MTYRDYLIQTGKAACDTCQCCLVEGKTGSLKFAFDRIEGRLYYACPVGVDMDNDDWGQYEDPTDDTLVALIESIGYNWAEERRWAYFEPNISPTDWLKDSATADLPCRDCPMFDTCDAVSDPDDVPALCPTDW